MPSFPTLLLRAVIHASFLLPATAVRAQGDQPPAAAKDHFAQQYPGAVVKEWEKKTKHYKVEFKLKDEKYEAHYALDGAWVRTEHDVPKSTLPPTITGALKAGKYASWKVKDVEQHATPQHAVLYKVEVEKDERKMEVFFTPDGQVLREQEGSK
ncbi:MAG TPA: PepSY-like domain-containing protein [Flavobacteriales bacterium]